MTTPSSSASSPAPRRRGRTRILVTAAVIGVIGAVLLTADTYLELPLLAISPLAVAPFIGISLFIPVLAMALLRERFVGLEASVIAGLVAMPATGFLFFVPAAGLVSGLLAEAPVAVGRYRHWQWWRFAVSAVLQGAVMVGIHWQLWGLAAMVPGLQIATVVVVFASEFAWVGIAIAVARGLHRAGLGAQRVEPAAVPALS